LPVFDQAGEPVPLLAETGPQARLVGNDCRVLDAGGNPLPHLFAIGLAAGFVPHGKLGGEPSFRGQANGLWLWQSDVGGLIVDAILSPSVDQDFGVEPFDLGRWEPAGAEPVALVQELEV
jgi:hypothetical protein